MNNANVFYSLDNNYAAMTDEELISLIKNDDKYALDFIIEKYKSLVNMKVGKYFIIGAEKEDIVQEGMIGLFKAIQSYSPDKQNSFKTFANMCIERQLITAIKTSNRQKHIPLNSYLSLNISSGLSGRKSSSSGRISSTVLISSVAASPAVSSTSPPDEYPYSNGVLFTIERIRLLYITELVYPLISSASMADKPNEPR